MNKIEITRRQYEAFKKDPLPGTRIDMECSYWLEYEDTGGTTDAPADGWVTGHHRDKGIRRSRLCTLKILDESRVPKSGVGAVASAGVLSILKAEPGLLGRDVARKLVEQLPKHIPDVPTASSWVSILIENQALAFRNP